jgi:transcriptional regulator of acetoin/glycerol metabolism
VTGPAWAGAADTKELARRLNAAHDSFLATGRAGRGVRPLVAASWQRCLSSGLDPEGSLAPVELTDQALEDWRRSHPLAPVMPVIRRLLVQDAAEAGLLVAVSDAAGRLLWVEGKNALRSQAQGMNFVEGAAWSESRAGTNAPGTALALDRPVQIFAAEHLSRPVTAWSCSAAPIHDPDTGAILGALDLTGGDEVASPYALSLVRATVAAVEGELRVQRLLAMHSLREQVPGRPPVSGMTLQTLGAATGIVERPDGLTRLSLRHSEILVLLAAHPEGLTGDQLSVALHDDDVAMVTLRAELSRLRPLLAPLELASRPYRLAQRLPTDADEVRRQLADGNVGAAVARYRGPVLPRSDAPGVVRLRGQLHAQLRDALVRVGDPDALLRFADTDHGRLDYAVWQAVSATLPAWSSRGAQVRDHLAYLERELGA